MTAAWGVLLGKITYIVLKNECKIRYLHNSYKIIYYNKLKVTVVSNVLKKL